MRPRPPPVTIDRQKLREEIEILQRLADWARSIGIDTKTQTLLKALEIGFEQMATTGAAAQGADLHRVAPHPGVPEDLPRIARLPRAGGAVSTAPTAGRKRQRSTNDGSRRTAETGRASGSRAVDIRTALIEHFRDDADNPARHRGRG